MNEAPAFGNSCTPAGLRPNPVKNILYSSPFCIPLSFNKKENTLSPTKPLLRLLPCRESFQTDNMTLSGALPLRCLFTNQPMNETEICREFSWVLQKAVEEHCDLSPLPMLLIYSGLYSCFIQTQTERLCERSLIEEAVFDRQYKKKKVLNKVGYFHILLVIIIE